MLKSTTELCEIECLKTVKLNPDFEKAQLWPIAALINPSTPVTGKIDVFSC